MKGKGYLKWDVRVVGSIFHKTQDPFYTHPKICTAPLLCCYYSTHLNVCWGHSTLCSSWHPILKPIMPQRLWLDGRFGSRNKWMGSRWVKLISGAVMLILIVPNGEVMDEAIINYKRVWIWYSPHHQTKRLQERIVTYVYH